MAIADTRYTSICEISSRSVDSVVLWRRKTAIFAIFCHFWTLEFSDVANCRRSQKLSAGRQLQTFPYPTASKTFLYSNAFMAKTGAQTLTLKSVTDKQTDRQKTQRFRPPRRRVKSEPHQTWHGDRGPRARSCTSKTFGV